MAELLDAFCAARLAASNALPPPEGPWSILLSELQRQGRGFPTFDDATVEDAIQDFYVAFSRAAAGGASSIDAIDSDAGVRGFMRNALRNNCLTYWRHTSPEVEAATIDVVDPESEQPYGRLLQRLQLETLATARAIFLSRLIPCVAEEARLQPARQLSAKKFLEVVQHLATLEEQKQIELADVGPRRAYQRARHLVVSFLPRCCVKHQMVQEWLDDALAGALSLSEQMDRLEVLATRERTVEPAVGAVFVVAHRIFNTFQAGPRIDGQAQ